MPLLQRIGTLWLLAALALPGAGLAASAGEPEAAAQRLEVIYYYLPG